MARISTYQHDAMPHADDNVIGTNQSPGHANETVLFSLANIQALFREGTFFSQSFNFTFNPDSTDSPTVRLVHNLGTFAINYQVMIRVVDVEGGVSYVPLERYPGNTFLDTQVYAEDNNTLVVEFPSGIDITAEIIITA